MSIQENPIELSKIYEEAPITEPQRQYYFMELLKKIVKQRSEALDVPFAFAVSPSAAR